MCGINKEIKISMKIKDFDKEKQISANEVYYAINFDKKELNKLGKNIKVIEIDCKKCRNSKSLWKEYDNKELLPSYFGNNWDAFYDSIFYFEFFEQYDLVIFILNDFEYFLEEEQ
ncbi:MAG: barstar family protein, partial [Endomicrobia bacterium]|nr:barstar family protein [Endomicrobiia bacterium]